MHIDKTNFIKQAYDISVNKPAQSHTTIEANAKNSQTDTVTISETGKKAEQQWQTIAKQYDLNHISMNEVRTMSQSLFESGFISTGEMMVLSAPRSLNEQSAEKHDFLAEMKNTFELNRNQSNQTEESKQLLQNTMAILERLHQSRHELTKL